MIHIFLGVVCALYLSWLKIKITITDFVLLQSSIVGNPRPVSLTDSDLKLGHNAQMHIEYEQI